jgi:dephospho-CoA kinase
MIPSRKPIIGIAGGIGSGKSYVARLFGGLGCLVVHSDDQVREAYRDERVKRALRQWWGDHVFDAAGEVDRRAIAARVFNDPAERLRLEQLLHPMVAEQRDRLMAAAADDPQVLAYVWDTPLLFETGLNRECDAIVFVDAPFETRLARVRRTRGWDAAELSRREKLQTPLDTKREMSDYVIRNAADAGGPSGLDRDGLRGQVRDVLSQILEPSSDRPPTG